MLKREHVRSHIKALQKNWEEEIGEELVGFLATYEIEEIPQTGILLQPGSSFYLILDKHNAFPAPCELKTPVKTYFSLEISYLFISTLI